MQWKTRCLAVLLVAVSLIGCAHPLNSRSHMGAPMEHSIYTLGAWHVQPGKEADFISAWKDLGTIFASLPHAPAGKGLLVQSVADSTLFYSFGPWRSLEDVTAMRRAPQAQAGLARLRELCVEAAPGAFRVVAESP
jgi:heme-degrading monooxygenase HmoA